MILLALAFFALALFDIWFTQRLAKRLGIDEIELNPLARKAMKAFGIVSGLSLAVLGPALIGWALLLGQQLLTPAAIWLGMRVNLFLSQCAFLVKFDEKMLLLVKRRR